MSKKPSNITGWIIILLIHSQCAFSQTPVSVKATYNRSQILIGEPIQLTLEVKTPLGAHVIWFSLDSIPHFEYILKGKIDSAMTNDEKSFRQDLLITSFDSGTWIFPSLPVLVNGTSYLTDSTVVEVNFSKFNPNQDYHDIKDIVDVPNPYAKWIGWSVALFTLFSLGMLVYFLQKKEASPDQKPAPVPRLSPYEEAVRALSALRSEKLAESGQVKLYYTRLNDILRLYVLRQLQIASLVKTNEELIVQLKQPELTPEQFSRLAQALRISDYVKFARYVPDQNDNEQNFDIIRSSVDVLNGIEKK